MLAPGDVERIAAHLGNTPGEVLGSLLLASPGALVMHMNPVPRAFRIPTIVPATKPDGTCIWLQEDGRCAIHSVAPAGCAYFDAHMSVNEGSARSAWFLRRIMESDKYARHIEVLRLFDRISKTPEEKRRVCS